MEKHILLLVFLISFLSCSNHRDSAEINANMIIGRWHVSGFEQTIMYQFTTKLRYTIYSTDGDFGTIDEALPNPNAWVMQNDEIVMDLFSGNKSTFTPIFKCNGNVVDIIENKSGQTFLCLFKENYDINKCIK